MSEGFSYIGFGLMCILIAIAFGICNGHIPVALGAR